MGQPFNFGFDYDGEPLDDWVPHPMSASTTIITTEPRPIVNLTLGTSTGIHPVRNSEYVRRTKIPKENKYNMSKHKFE